MAIGDGNGYNNQQRSNVDRSYYSRLRVRNGDLNLGFQFSGGLLNISIDEKEDGFKFNSLQKISLSPTKAKLMTHQIKKFKEYVAAGDIDPNVAFGVNAGMNDKVSYIGLHATADGVPMVTIGKFDNDGVILEHTSITFNSGYHFALDWSNIETNSVDKAYYDSTDLDIFEQIITNFANNMDGALAYSVFDTGRYELQRILGKMDPIYDKLGIERLQNGRNYNRGNSFLDSQSASSISSSPTSIDDIL